MKVALVHDYLNEFGGAERVLLSMSKIWPEAPIYTAFYKKNSPAGWRFINHDIRPSFVHHLPFFAGKLHSPLRFLAPLIWNSFDFSEYDVVIGSASWYITKGFRGKGPGTVEVCYCHTPPRWLYGYPTSVEWQRYLPVRVYAQVIGHLMRNYDVQAAQRVDYFVANSQTVAKRIWKFYRRKSTVIYPPVTRQKPFLKPRQDYYLVASRLVGGKGLDLAVKAAIAKGFNLKVVGRPAGYSTAYRQLRQLAEGYPVEFLGYVSDDKLTQLYARAKAFLALASDEDFGLTPVEAMMTGTPVVAFRGGGYLESVIEADDGEKKNTGVFFDELTAESLGSAIDRVTKTQFDHQAIHDHACNFAEDCFQKKIKALVQHVATRPNRRC